MARQLDLLPPTSADEDWRLDPDTIETGRRGLAKARAALAAAQARQAAERDIHTHRTAA